MHLRKLFLCMMLIIVSGGLWAQNAVFTGHVTDSAGAARERQLGKIFASSQHQERCSKSTLRFLCRWMRFDLFERIN